MRGWRADAEATALLAAATTAGLERALTLALEAVGSALQASVTAQVVPQPPLFGVWRRLVVFDCWQ